MGKLLILTLVCVLVLAALTQAKSSQSKNVQEKQMSKTKRDAELRGRTNDNKQLKKMKRRKKIRKRKNTHTTEKVGRRESRKRESRKYEGSHCEWIDLNSVASNSGCAAGTKFVIKQKAKTVRKQFGLVKKGSSTVVALLFVTKGIKFTACTSVTEVTASVTCKTIDGLSAMDMTALAASSSSSDTTTASSVTTTASTAASTTTTAASSSSSCKCGVKKSGTKIVGGSETAVNEYPWMASMMDSLGHLCGGSLIASQWVVTAAHCFYNTQGELVITDPSAITVALGEHDSAVTTETNIRIVKDVTQIIRHASYVFSTNINDIALLKLSSTVDLKTYTPVCLPATTAGNYAGKNAWVYGWGALSQGGSSPTKLQELEVPVVTDAQCKTAMGTSVNDDLLAVMLCAGGVEGKDSCQGDSGGPLSYDNSGQHELIGVVSWGLGCAQAGTYGVYAEVTALRTWVDTNIASNGGATYC